MWAGGGTRGDGGAAGAASEAAAAGPRARARARARGALRAPAPPPHLERVQLAQARGVLGHDKGVHGGAKGRRELEQRVQRGVAEQRAQLLARARGQRRHQRVHGDVVDVHDAGEHALGGCGHAQKLGGGQRPVARLERQQALGRGQRRRQAAGDAAAAGSKVARRTRRRPPAARPTRGATHSMPAAAASADDTEASLAHCCAAAASALDIRCARSSACEEEGGRARSMGQEARAKRPGCSKRRRRRRRWRQRARACAHARC